MSEKAPVMIPDDDQHHEALVTEHGYRDCTLVEAIQDGIGMVSLRIEDEETGDTLVVDDVNISALYGANKSKLPDNLRSELEDTYEPGGGFDLARVAEGMFIDGGVPFVYHESTFEA